MGSSPSAAEDGKAAALRQQAEHLEKQHDELAASLASSRGRIANTETQVAKTLDRLAANRPESAERLRAKAQTAREYAAKQRRLVDEPGEAQQP